MAIDTPQKRFSMMNHGGIGGVPYPTGAMGAAARAAWLDLYAMGLGAPTTPHVVFLSNTSIATVTIAARVAMTPIDFAALYFDPGGLAVTYQLFGELASGLTFTSAGVLSGTPLSDQWYGPFYVLATDENAATAESNAFMLFLDPAGLEPGELRSGFSFDFGFNW
jgi:hypothetical protein